jgi:hypothetical protein
MGIKKTLFLARSVVFAAALIAGCGGGGKAGGGAGSVGHRRSFDVNVN